MKKHMELTAVVAVAVTLAMSGWGVAAEPEKAKVPKIGDWEYFEASETGNLHPETRVLNKKSLSDDPTPRVEIGGRIFRIGVDTL